MTVAASRPSWIEVDLDAIRANAAALAALCAPAELCAVVKADGYGHGAVPVASAAVEGGASWLGVAVVEEGLALREAGIRADVLVLADAPTEAVGPALEAGLTLTVSSRASIDDIAAAGPSGTRVHLKIDTGMHRLGCNPAEAEPLTRHVDAAGLELEGVFTHLACADDPAQDDVTARQLDLFDQALAAMYSAGFAPRLVHAASSAGALHHPVSRSALVRCGISLYGYAPSPLRALPADLTLQPALTLRSEVVAVRGLPVGDGVSYGWKRRAERPGRVATVPLGYADGVPRSLSENGEVLIRGRRRPLAGVVTMDQIMVECGDDVEVGDEVMLIGVQDAEQITADEWGRLTGTISYEILARLGPRLPRRYF